LILEVKDWKPSTIVQADKESWVILADGRPKTKVDPIFQTVI